MQGFNLARHVLRQGAQTPDKLALSVISPTGAERWSYARLIAAVRGTASGLLARGLQPGQRVLIRIGNEPGFPIVYLGAIAAGLVAVPTSPALTRHEITVLAGDLKPSLVIAGAGVALPDGDWPVIDTEELAGFAGLPPAPWAMGDPDRPGYVVFTSGSSGRPRAVIHAHRAILAREMMFQGWYGLRSDDRLLHAGAFNWTFTLGTGLMDPWTIGATALVPAPGTEIAQLPLLAARHGASVIAAAPGVFRRMLRSPWQSWSELRHGLTAGERLAPNLRQDWQARTGTDLHEAMGMSECSTFLSGSPDRPAPMGFAGYPQPGRRVALLDEAGQVLDPGGVGVLAVHRDDPGLFLGYDGQPAETAARYRGDWFVTGDLGQAREDGAIEILGRDDDMMNAGGYRLAPAEVEEVLGAVPDAGDIAVTQIETTSGARIICAFWTGGASRPALEAAASERLADYKRPRELIHLDALPRTNTGKIDRRRLRDDHRKT